MSLWELLEKESPETIDEYWKIVPAWRLEANKDALTKANNKLIEYKRFSSAIQLLAWNTELADSETIANTLLHSINEPNEEKTQPRHFDVKRLFDIVRSNKEELDHNTVIRLEWAYLPLLGNDLMSTGSKILEAEIAKNQAFLLRS